MRGSGQGRGSNGEVEKGVQERSKEKHKDSENLKLDEKKETSQDALAKYEIAGGGTQKTCTKKNEEASEVKHETAVTLKIQRNEN